MKVVTIFARGESAKFIDNLQKPDFTVIVTLQSGRVPAGAEHAWLCDSCVGKNE